MAMWPGFGDEITCGQFPSILYLTELGHNSRLSEQCDAGVTQILPTLPKLTLLRVKDDLNSNNFRVYDTSRRIRLTGLAVRARFCTVYPTLTQSSYEWTEPLT